MNFRFGGKSPQQPWHPDFSDKSRLPDIKLVRTHFIYNIIPILLCLSVAVYFGVNELVAIKLNGEIASLNASIDGRRSESEVAIKQSMEFEKASYVAHSLHDFFANTLDPLDYLILIARNRPKDIIFDELDFRGKERALVQQNGMQKEQKQELVYILGLTGSIPGNYDYALDRLNEYRDMLRGLDKVKDILQEIEIASLKRDPELGVFAYEFNIILKPRE